MKLFSTFNIRNVWSLRLQTRLSQRSQAPDPFLVTFEPPTPTVTTTSTVDNVYAMETLGPDSREVEEGDAFYEPFDSGIKYQFLIILE